MDDRREMEVASDSFAGTVVLVHGGFVDGSGWQGVYSLLKKEGGEQRLAEIRDGLQSLMETKVGIFREDGGLREALREIRELKGRLLSAKVDDRGRIFNMEMIHAFELDFMLDVAESVAFSALMREESRGAHFRTDFPRRDDKSFLMHQLLYHTPQGPRLEKLAVNLTRWQPTERKY